MKIKTQFCLLPIYRASLFMLSHQVLIRWATCSRLLYPKSHTVEAHMFLTKLNSSLYIMQDNTFVRAM